MGLRDCFYRQIRSAVEKAFGRVYSDIPADYLAAAGRVLTTATQRADAELAAA